jgi:hypothetical protein
MRENNKMPAYVGNRDDLVRFINALRSEAKQRQDI